MRAAVYVVAAGADQWVLKDFSKTNALIRHTLGRLLVSREWSSLCRLQGMAGIPMEPFLVSPFVFGYRFVSGETLSSLKQRQSPLGQEFFLALEQLVAQLHARGYVHLDLRNGKNILVTPDHRPRLLDFQSGLWLHHLPPRWRRALEDIDCSGVYKWWLRMDPASIDPQRRDMLQIVNRQRRRWWRFNYPVAKDRLYD
jgi:RIO-like serine/threonine protein kinase